MEPTYVRELFSPFGEITVRKMFGGLGIYCEGNIFALEADGIIWLKVDDVTRAEFEQAGLEPFSFEFNNGKSGTMSYYNAPDDMFDDHDVLSHWVSLSLGAAMRNTKPKKKKTKAKTSGKKPAGKKSAGKKPSAKKSPRVKPADKG